MTSQSDHRDRHAVGVFLAGVVGVVALVGYLFWNGYSVVRQQAEVTTQNLANVISIDLEAKFSRVDGDLRSFTRTIGVEDFSASITGARRQDIVATLRDQLFQFPEVSQYRLVDADGRSVAETSPSLEEIEPTEWFRILRATAGMELVLSEARDGRLSMAVAKRDGSGAFAGAAIGTITLHSIQEQMDGLDVGPQGLIVIRRVDNGGLVLRRPHSLGQQAQSPLLARIRAGERWGTGDLVFPSDGIDRTYGYRQLRNYPLFVTVAFAKGDYLGAWALQTAVLAVASGILLGFLTLLFLRQRRAQAETDAARHSLADALGFNEAIIDGANIGMAAYGHGGECILANAAFASIKGMSQDRVLAQNFRTLDSWRASGMLDAALKILDGGGSKRFDTQLTSTAGRTAWVECRFLRFFRNDERHLLLLLSDITERKMTENLLREKFAALARLEEAQRASEQMLRLVIDNLPALAAYWDRDQRCRFANITFREWLGLPAERIVGQSMAEVLGPDLHAENQSHVLGALAGQPQQFERTVRRADGATRHIQAHYIPHVDGDRVQGFFALVFDVSALHEARLKLEALTAFQDSVLNSAAVAIIATDPNGVITLFNSKAEAMLGYAAGEMIGKWTPEVIHLPEELAAQAEILSRETGKPVEPGLGIVVARARSQPFDEREWTFVRKDGSKLPVLLSVSAIRSPDGRIIGFLGVAADISGRRKAERQLRDNEARMRAIVENTMDGIITIDPRGIIHTVNPAAERLFGYAAAEVVGNNVKMLMPEPHQGRHDGYLADYMSSGIPKVIGIGREVEGLTKSGETFPMELAVSEVQLQGLRMFIGTVHDISERKKIDRMKADFISTVSHELRTPLTAIRGSLSLVNTGVLGDFPAEIRELTEIAEQSTVRLVRLINDILDIEKIGSGHLKLEMTEIAVAGMLARAMTDNAPFATQYGVALASRSLDSDLRVIADFDRLLQVLTNLVSNAVKFSPRGGLVTLEVARRDADRVRFSVRDRGPGIPDTFRSQIFGKFAQADTSDHKLKGGTGLGLSITKGLVERMGGGISFESEAGEGSVFHVDLPSIRSPDMVGGETRPGTETVRILHIEDDAATRSMIARLLAPHAMVIGAATVEEGIRVAEGQCFDLAIIDLGLPDGNGLDVMEWLRNSDGARPPVVVFTAADEVPAALAAGIHSAFVKSRISERDFLEVIISLLPPSVIPAETQA
ncbi:histidine kinase [Paramagnetospirillum caucaseum]|uniref:Sensor protein FixL n=1 Tax=Paramagnetospirillum caucaseum TaxID=1244869 RepID=M2Y6Z6_9PROT|nr:PAS domain S-box protein [Paramagnetospirillum caucaseum]EME68831.1 histidine kinase [Paramagnetospirillum caucaseum]